MNSRKTIVLVALLGAAFAAPSLKNKLNQVNAKNLAQYGGEETPVGSGSGSGDSCLVDINDLHLPALGECTIGSAPLPGLGSGENGGLQTTVLQSSVLQLSQVPDTAYSQVCRSNCAECGQSSHAAIAAKSKNRTFTIEGAISVIESVRYCETDYAAEQSASEAEKDTYCVLNNLGPGLGDTPNCTEWDVCVEYPQPVGHGNGAGLGRE